MISVLMKNGWLMSVILNLNDQFPVTVKNFAPFFSRFFPTFFLEVKNAVISRARDNISNDKLELISARESGDLQEWYKDFFYDLNASDFYFLGVFPPSESSIAKYNSSVFLDQVSNHCIVPTNLNFQNAITLNKNLSPMVLPHELFQHPHLDKTILVSLGNSPDHINTLKILTRISAQNSNFKWNLQLHDVSIIWLLELSFGYSFMKTQMSEVYDSELFPSKPSNSMSRLEKINEGVFGISILCKMFGMPEKIIVHNNRARELIMRDLNYISEKCSISVLQLPYLESVPLPVIQADVVFDKDKKIRIGTFGIADSHKNLEETFELLKELKSLGCDLIWVLAGRNTRNYAKLIGANLEWIEVHDDLDEVEFIELMTQMDFMMVLRLNSNGESSGVVIQAQNLGIPLIVSSSIVNGYDHEKVLIVDEVHSVSQSAVAILDFISNLKTSTSSTFNIPNSAQIFTQIRDEL